MLDIEVRLGEREEAFLGKRKGEKMGQRLNDPSGTNLNEGRGRKVRHVINTSKAYARRQFVLSKSVVLLAKFPPSANFPLTDSHTTAQEIIPRNDRYPCLSGFNDSRQDVGSVND